MLRLMKIEMLTFPVLLLLLQCQQIFAYDSRNIALNKPATQLSTYNDGIHDWSARHAVDGDKTCRYSTWQHYSATKSAGQSWWRVDLQQRYNISRVVVHGQPMDTNDELTGFKLYLTDKPEDSPNSSSPVYTNTGYINHGVFIIRTSKIARYCMLLRTDWYKPIVLCEVEIYGTVVGRSHVTTSMSSVGTYNTPQNTWQSSNVIDNVILGNPNLCKCCAGTSGKEPPWLQIDFGRNYRISLITIYGRTDGSSGEQYMNLNIFVSNTSMGTVNGSLVFSGNPNNGTYTYTLPLKPPKSFRFLMIRRFTASLMTICEVQYVEEKCSHGTYGQECNEICGHCRNGEPCNYVNGTCASGCADGYMYNRICKSVCPHGSYGTGCLNSCGNCKNNQTCNHINGTCKSGCAIGYKSDNVCKTPCDNTHFGEGCRNVCHCMNDAACDNDNGMCPPGGCTAGWKGHACDKKCTNNTFGPNCVHHCHCVNNSQCNISDGYCSKGCDVGWAGYNCSLDKNILRTMKEQTTTSMSSTAHNWTSDLAIDGEAGPDPEGCHCCSGTQNSQKSWWMVDMGTLYPVNHITVYSRHNEQSYQQLTGFQLYLAKDTDPHSFTLVRNSTERIWNNRHEVTFQSTVTRYVKIQRPGILTLCEVLVYKGECQVGTFGDECSQRCHCADERSCDEITGHCQSPACKTGWTGLACNKQCPQDTFGDQCTEMCFCAEGTCTNSYGICHGKCRHGYTGPHCNEADIINKQNETYVVHASSEHKTTTAIGTDVHGRNQLKTTKVIGGAVGGSVAVLVVIVAISAIVFKLRKRNSDDSKTDYTTPDITPSQLEGEYDTLDNLNDNQRQINSTYENERVTVF